MGVEFSLTGTGPPSPGWLKQHRGTDWLSPGEAREEAACPAPQGDCAPPACTAAARGPCQREVLLLLFFLRLLLLFFPRAAEHSERTEELWMLALSKSDSSRSSSSLCGAGEGPVSPGRCGALSPRPSLGGGRGAGLAGGSEAQCLCGPSRLSTQLETDRSNLMSYSCPQGLLSSLIFHLNTSPQAAPSTLPNSYTSLKGKPRGPRAQGAFPGLSLIEPVAQPVCQVPPAPPPVTGPLPAYMPTPLPD